LCGQEGFGNDDGNWSRRKLCKGKFFWLCKQCSLAYKNNQYCDFCKQIYLDTDDNASMDGQEWIFCENCKKWEHTDCEIAHGYENLAELVNQEGFKYFCVTCRKKRQDPGSPLRNGSSTPNFNKNSEKFCCLELQSLDKEDDSHFSDESLLQMVPTTESQCDSQSTSEKREYKSESLNLNNKNLSATSDLTIDD
jgi:hypothetical protein